MSILCDAATEIYNTQTTWRSGNVVRRFSEVTLYVGPG